MSWTDDKELRAAIAMVVKGYSYAYETPDIDAAAEIVLAYLAEPERPEALGEDEARELLEAHGKKVYREESSGWWVCEGFPEQTLRDLCIAFGLYDPETRERKAVPSE